MSLKTYHTANENAQACTLDASAPSSWECQTFVPFDSYTATSLKLKCYRNDSGATGTITIGIRAVDGDKKPTGANLDYGTIDVSGLGTSSPGAWVTVTLDSGLALTAGTRYALVIYSSDISASDFVYFRTSSTTNYAFGTRGYSSDAGSSWSLYAGNTSDVVFKIYDDSTYTPQALFVGGAVYDGNHLWRVTDDGESLTLVDSYALSGDVSCLAYSSDSGRLYVGIGSSVYCYNANDITLVTSWGSSGSVAVGATVNGLAINPGYPSDYYADYLVVAHASVSGNYITLYDDDGASVWSSTSQGTRVSFDLSGNIHYGAAAQKLTGGLLNYSTGALLNSYFTAGIFGYDSKGIVRDDEISTRCYYFTDYSLTQLFCYAGNSRIWTKNISGTLASDIIHLSDTNLVIVANSAGLNGYYDVDGGTHSWADYNPAINLHSTEGVINKLDKNDNNEFYAVTNSGYLCVGNPALSYRTSSQISTAALNGVAWIGDYYSPISASGGGTGGGSADLTYGVWRRVLTEYMPDYEGNIKNFTVQDLTASRLVGSDANKKLESIAIPLIVAKGGTGATSLTDHSLLVGSGTSAITALGAATNGQLPIGSTGADPTLATLTGTSEQIAVTNGVGSITLAIDDPLTLPGKLKAGSFGSPTDVTATREYGAELHYSGNNYNVTGIRSRASLVTTDTTASCQGGLLQAANNDGINAGVLNGCLIEAIGKSDSTAATISTMRGCLINTEWNAKDTVTDLRVLHVRTHTRDSATEGYFSNSGYGIYIENEAVGGNGQALTAGIYFKDTNISGGNSAFAYGIDFTGGTFGTADINLSANPIINANGTQQIKIDDTNRNFLLGSDAFQNDNGQYNIGLGYQAGYNNDTTGSASYGDYNAYIGYQSGYGETGGTKNTGYYNVGLGYKTLYRNTTGYGNSAIGYRALYCNTTGYGNSAIGYRALYCNNTGYLNLAIGYSALYYNTTGNRNMAMGYAALTYNTTGNRNMAMGFAAGYYNQTGDYNAIIGAYAGGYGAGALNSFDRDIFIGYASGYNITAGSDNVFIGYRSGYNQTTNSNLLIIDNQDRSSAANEAVQSLIYGTFNATPSSQSVTFNSDVNIRHHLVGIPDEITATDAGVAASLDTINTEVTTNGDSDLDNVTLANGTSGQIKHIYCVVEGNAGDTWKITPATMCGGTQITFAGAGEGCTLVYADSEGWVIAGNNGGTIS